MNILEIKNLDVIYKVKDKNIHAVRDVSMEIEKKDSIGIVGESGSGKSTLAMAILRLHPPKITNITGEVLFNDIDILKMNEDKFRDIRWRDISVVFQKSMNSLSPVHKIGKQMEDIYKVHNKNTPKEKIKQKIINIFKIINLNERVYELYPHELSGGMMQRVSIALSLINDPKLLVMDEATTALDVVTESQILDEIIKLEENIDLTRIMITHDVSVVASTCKKIAVMYAGTLLECGYVKDVLKTPKHPYTQGLLKSYPTFKGEKNDLRGIPGSLPDLSQEIKGCVFKDRCEKVCDKCLNITPNLIDLGNKWKVACHLVGGEDDGSFKSQ